MENPFDQLEEPWNYQPWIVQHIFCFVMAMALYSLGGWIIVSLYTQSWISTASTMSTSPTKAFSCFIYLNDTIHISVWRSWQMAIPTSMTLRTDQRSKCRVDVSLDCNDRITNNRQNCPHDAGQTTPFSLASANGEGDSDHFLRQISTAVLEIPPWMNIKTKKY